MGFVCRCHANPCLSLSPEGRAAYNQQWIITSDGKGHLYPGNVTKLKSSLALIKESSSSEQRNWEVQVHAAGDDCWTLIWERFWKRFLKSSIYYFYNTKDMQKFISYKIVATYQHFMRNIYEHERFWRLHLISNWDLPALCYKTHSGNGAVNSDWSRVVILCFASNKI